MSTLVITTNNVPRDIIQSWELTQQERDDLGFDEDFWDDAIEGRTSPEFFRYKGQVYYIETGEGYLPDSDWFYMSESFSSGICFRFPVNDCWSPGNFDLDYERIIVGRYYVS